MNGHVELIEKFIASFEFVAVNLDFFEDLDGVAAKLAARPAKDYGHRQQSFLRVFRRSMKN
jgi:hypothetical protein